MGEMTVAVPGADSLQAAVRNEREWALKSPEHWANALRDLNPEDENRVVFAVMEDDDANAGRVLRQVLRAAILESATQVAKDRMEGLA